jgi:hypothetical protein
VNEPAGAPVSIRTATLADIPPDIRLIPAAHENDGAAGAQPRHALRRG